MTEDGFERAAMRELQGPRIGFRIHLAVYLMVHALLIAVWYMGPQATFWPIFPMLGWGIGIVAHYMAVRAVTKRY
jgi:hypothetical protein